MKTKTKVKKHSRSTTNPMVFYKCHIPLINYEYTGWGKTPQEAEKQAKLAYKKFKIRFPNSEYTTFNGMMEYIGGYIAKVKTGTYTIEGNENIVKTY